MSQIKLFVMAMCVFLLLDSIWLGYLAKNLYIQGLGHLMKSEHTALTTYLPGFLVYLTLVIGIILFVLPKAAGNALASFGWGAMFGFVCYTVYDLTNMAILNNWPLWISLIDIAWGCFVCGVTSFITTLLR